MTHSLYHAIRDCTICADHLPLGCRPIFAAHPSARIAIIGQAPGRRVHENGIPWQDPSGDNLRQWLQVSDDTFYNPQCFALVPMGFCFPGTGSSGDLPPRPECAPQWHEALLETMPHLQLRLLVGQYAQAYYLGNRRRANLTETVRAWNTYWPDCWPLPHPSPRNNRWMKKNPWFRESTLPALAAQVQTLLHGPGHG